MKYPKLEVYEARDGWRWRLRSANGRILCSGEAHTRKQDAERAVKTAMATMATIHKLRVIDRAWDAKSTPALSTAVI